MSSVELGEVLLQTFWAVATALTTDIDGTTRGWLIRKFTQAYFDSAKKRIARLDALGDHGGTDQDIFESYRNDYESVLCEIAGKPVMRVKKPLWSDLEVSVRATVLRLAHQARNQARERFADCFDYALYTQRSLASARPNVQANMQGKAPESADAKAAPVDVFKSVDHRIDTQKSKKHKCTDLQASHCKRQGTQDEDLCDFFGPDKYQARTRSWSPQKHQPK
jgi:hypothetical protein